MTQKRILYSFTSFPLNNQVLFWCKMICMGVMDV